MDFCYVIEDKKMKGSGLSRGDIVLVTGTRVVPAGYKDPYLQRVLVVAVKLDKKAELLQMPTETNDNKAYLIDPRNLSRVNEEDQKCFEAMIEKQYGEK